THPVDLISWHCRFGHAGIHRILDMHRSKLVAGLDIMTKDFDGHKCVPCLHGKGTCRPFDAVVAHKTEVLERVHT
ncbi:hypothetical protein K435DRAFT_618633, partial [Dendrothele bispora CBS 962.96]